jgi:hypothetical protein
MDSILALHLVSFSWQKYYSLEVMIMDTLLQDTLLLLQAEQEA